MNKDEELKYRTELEIIYRTFGKTAQLQKLREECFECADAITEFLNKRGTWGHVVEEFSDMQVVGEQLLLQRVIDPYRVEEIKKFKTERTIKRIRNNYYERDYEKK